MILDNCEATTKYFCELLGITRFVFYTYISEINIFLEEYYHITNDYTHNLTIKYDKLLKRYCLVEID